MQAWSKGHLEYPTTHAIMVMTREAKLLEQSERQDLNKLMTDEVVELLMQEDEKEYVGEAIECLVWQVDLFLELCVNQLVYL